MRFVLLHACVLSAGLLIAFWPTIVSGFTSLQTDPGDTLLNHYILEHTWKCVSDSRYVGTLWSPPCFFPVQGTLAYSENLLGAAPFYWLFRITSNELMAYQLWMLSVAGLTYISMAWTLRKFGVRHLLAALGGLAFAFGLPRVNQLMHQQLLPAMFSPPAVYFGWRFLDAPRLASVIGILVCTFLQVLASIYLGWFLAFGLSILFMVRLLIDRDARSRFAQFVVGRWRPMVMCIGITVVVLLPILIPYSIANRGFRRHFSEVTMMLPTPSSWVSPAPASWWANVLPAVDGPFGHEHHNFSGVVLPTLLAVSLGWLWRQRKRRASLPSPGFAGEGPGVRASPQDRPHPNPLPQSRERGPDGERFAFVVLLTALCLVILSMKFGDFTAWRWVYAIVPGAKAIRAVTRIFTIVYLLAWIGALVLADRRLREWGRAGVMIAGVLLFIGAFEQIQPRLPAFDPRPFFVEVDRLAGELHGAPAAYIEPDGDVHFWTSQIAAMWAGLKANVPVVNGYSGRTPKGYPDSRMILDVNDVAAWTGRADVRIVGPVRLAAAYPAPVTSVHFRPYRSTGHAARMK